MPTILGLDGWGRKKKDQLKEERSQGINSVKRPNISWKNKTEVLSQGRDKKRKVPELGGQKKKESPYLRGEMWFLSRRQHRYNQSNFYFFLKIGMPILALLPELILQAMAVLRLIFTWHN